MDPAIQREIRRRLDEIRRRPSELMRYDRNGDGRIDDEEWEEVRRVITLEVQTEHRRKTATSVAGNGDLEDLLGGRFRILGLLGEGAQGRTYHAEDTQSPGGQVAIKELDFQQADSWKAIELFDREAQTLQFLNHPNIPAYIDAFHQTDGDGHERFFLVQEFVDGTDFESLIAAGQTNFTEEEARDLLRQILEILVYLQERSPPVIHRDIKPSNLMRRPDGSVALIDFGAVQSVLPDAQGGSTIIGTSGYMPVEQLMGRAVPATDLYALGATMVHLLSGRHPADLPMRRMAIDFARHVHVSPRFRRYLEKMLQPDVEERFQTAREALDALNALDRQAAVSPAVPVELSQGPRKPVELTPTKVVAGASAASALFSVFLFAVILVPSTNCGRFSSKMMGYEDVVLEPLRTCKVAVDALGENADFAWVGCQTGESSGSCNSGRATWSVTVSGSEGRGRYDFSLTGTDGEWTLHSARLRVDGETHDLRNCELD